MDMSASITIGNGDLVATIARLGAELIRLQDRQGRDYLWDGNPAFWTGRAPILFPMVGRAANDRNIIGGTPYPMRQHGFARGSTFVVTASGPDRCTMTLAATDATLAIYPFRFRLDVTYVLAPGTLSITATVTNEDDKDMTVSFGFHPALRWPLPGSSDHAGHRIVFDHPEPAPIRRLADGLVTPERIPSPVVDRTLTLHDTLFRDDALVFDTLASRAVTYCGPAGQEIRLTFPDMPFLGVWTKPGAGFICIEPWHGLASPVDFEGEFADRPGVMSIPPNSDRVFGVTFASPQWR